MKKLYEFVFLGILFIFGCQADDRTNVMKNNDSQPADLTVEKAREALRRWVNCQFNDWSGGKNVISGADKGIEGFQDFKKITYYNDTVRIGHVDCELKKKYFSTKVKIGDRLTLISGEFYLSSNQWEAKTITYLEKRIYLEKKPK